MEPRSSVDRSGATSSRASNRLAWASVIWSTFVPTSATDPWRPRTRKVRNEVLGGHHPALTVVIAEIFDPRWLLEIEAVAAGG